MPDEAASELFASLSPTKIIAEASLVETASISLLLNERSRAGTQETEGVTRMDWHKGIEKLIRATIVGVILWQNHRFSVVYRFVCTNSLLLQKRLQYSSCKCRNWGGVLSSPKAEKTVKRSFHASLNTSDLWQCYRPAIQNTS